MHGWGVQVFPFTVYDGKVKTVEITVFGETKRTEVTTTAYDEAENPIYILGMEYGNWIWKKV